jgi:putative SOS response-associated peptidase YedK
MVRTSPAEALSSELGVDLTDLDLRSRWNVRPGEDVLAVVRAGGARRAGWLHWGLMPAPSRPAINARIETAATRPAFRDAFAKRRCLVVADGFYEWQRVEGSKRRLPWFIRLRSARPMTFAGIWQRWHPPDGPPLATCAVLTCAPNAMLASIHDRMPVIVPPERREEWLARGDAALGPYPSELLDAWPVSPLVNAPDADGPELLRRVREEELGDRRP